MNKVIGCTQIALRELWQCRRFFRMTALISVLLLTSMLASLSIVRQIPDTLNQYLDRFMYTDIEVRHVTQGDLDLFGELPVSVCGYHVNGLNNQAVGLPETCPGADFLLINGGGIGRADANLHAENPVSRIRRNLISGSKWTEADDAEAGIWLSEPAATTLHVQAGDTIPFQIADAVEADNQIISYQQISVLVKGIYRTWPACLTYYITIPAYAQSLEDDAFQFSAFIKCDDLLQIHQIKSKLNEHYLSVQADFDIVDSMSILIVALYVISAGLCILELLVLHSLIRSYFSQRSRFYAIMRAVGLSVRNMSIVIGALISGLFTCCFAVSLALSPLMTRYVCEIIQHVFGDIDLHVRNLNPLSAAVYPALLLIIGILSLLHVRSCRSRPIADRLRNSEENG